MGIFLFNNNESAINSSILIIFVILSAYLHIYYDIKKKYLHTYFYKPFTIILILIIALNRVTTSNEYQTAIILGLIFSLFGDIFLMLKKSDLFIKGLLFFLFAHLCYIYAVINNFGAQLNIFLIFVLLLILAVVGKFLILKTGDKKVYVFLYSCVVLFLSSQAASSYFEFPNTNTLYLLIGVILFTISDFLLAFNRFISKFSKSQIYILSTYYTAQLLIALSI
ncbi:MAG: lysoplasmalogenase [Melioribacteraceae bacterium]|nr:lysoplasmalogenase [Melioribacteraceae bacterium]